MKQVLKYNLNFRNPPAPFKSFYHNFYFNQGRLQHFINGLKSVINGDPAIKYAIVPISKGCKYSLEGSLLNSLNINLPFSSSTNHASGGTSYDKRRNAHVANGITRKSNHAVTYSSLPENKIDYLTKRVVSTVFQITYLEHG